MKYLYTLGRSGGQPSPFSYQRTRNGVEIKGQEEEYSFSHAEWEKIVNAVYGIGVCSITGSQSTSSLRDHIREALSGRQINDSEVACIVRILENEGTIELYHGAAGQGVSFAMMLRAAD